MNQMSKLRYAAVLSVLLGTSVIWGGTASAEEAMEFSLDTMVVTATRTERSVLNTPANVTVITQNDLQKGGFQSVFEAVKNLAQANNHTYQEDGGDYGGMMSRIRVRGIDDGTLVLVNGNPTNFMNKATLNTVPMDQIERIEIVKGSNSVLYGPQAMGGVINIITKRPNKTGKVTGSVGGGLGSNKKLASANVQTDVVNLGYKKTWNKDFNGAVMPGTTGKGTAINIVDKDSEQLYLDARLAKDLTFSWGRNSSDVKYEAGSFSNFNAVMNKLNRYRSIYNSYSLAYDNKDSGWKTVLGYGTMDLDCMPIKGTGSYSHYDAYNVNMDIQKTFKLGDKDTLIFGVNGNRESMEYVGSYLGDTGRNSFSAYQSWNVHTSDAFELILGLREYWIGSNEYYDSDFQLLPQVQGIYKVNDISNYYFNVGKSFEMPAINSGFYYGGNYAMNTTLKPQSGWTYELGYKMDNGTTAFSADVFHMDIKDKFFWDKDEEDRNIMRNRDDWENTGLEINCTHKMDENWTGSIGWTFQNPEATSKGVKTQDTARHILNLGANFDKGKFNWDTRLFAYVDREIAYYNREHTSSSAAKKDHYLKNSIDLAMTVTYRPTNMDRFRIIGGNLLNREDALNNYEYKTLPRNVLFTYERKF